MNRPWLHFWYGGWFGRTVTRVVWALPVWSQHWPRPVALMCRCGDGFESLHELWHGACWVCVARREEVE